MTEEPNVITATRRSICTALVAAGLAAWEIVPEQADPKCVVIDSDDPSLDFEGCVFGQVNLHHVALVIAGAGPNVDTAEVLDTMTIQVITALAETDHHVETVGRYGSADLNGQSYPAIEVFVSTVVEL